MQPDVRSLRARFPALQRIHQGRPVAYLDGPGGTQVPNDVIDAVSRAMATSVSNVGGRFAASLDSDRVVASAREAAADLLGGQADGIVLGPNMTTLTFSFSRAVARRLEPGDRVVVTGLDHDANVTPWVEAAQDRGAEAVFVDIDPEQVSLDLDHLERLVDERTRVVAVTGCSNAFGTQVDLTRVVAAGRAVGALTYVDAVHLAPHARIDVAELGVDALVCSAYKLFGPHVGMLWARRPLLEELRPYKVRPAPADPPENFETGTPSFPLLAGLVAAVDYLASLGDGSTRRSRLDAAFRWIGAHERKLGEALLAGLPPGIRLWGPASMDQRASTFALEVRGRTPAEAAALLGEEGIFAWAGHHYAVEPMERLGLLERGGLLRIGLVHTSTEEEVERVLEALSRLTA